VDHIIRSTRFRSLLGSLVAQTAAATRCPKRASKALILAAAAVCLASVSVVASGNPGREPYPPGPDLYINCPQGYVAVLHTIIDKEYIKTFTAADGTVRYKIEGRLVETWTGNGKTLTLNNSGPGTITFYPDGSVTIVTQGLTAVIPRTEDGFWVYTGQVKVDPDTGTIISHHGAVRDFCALLA
jgi:hypothetical protein